MTTSRSTPATHGIDPAPTQGDRLAESPPTALSDRDFQRALDALTAQDPFLAASVEQHGSPPFWQRDGGFATLAQIILEQQVSLASARAAYGRLCDRIGHPTPDTFLTLDDDQLRRCGFSRQKSRYVRNLAAALREGTLDLDALSDQGDDAARRSLCALTGIGPWTANVYLLMALRRPDIWPVGDIALATAWHERAQTAVRPGPSELADRAEAWRPWRSVAARILWHDYLCARNLAW